MEQHERGADDDEVAEEQDAPDGDVLVFVDHGSDDVCTSCTSSYGEDQSQSGSTEEGTDQDRHEGLVGQQGFPLQQPLEEGEGGGEGEHTEDGLDQELQAQYLQGYQEQRYVDDEVGDGDRDHLVRGKEDEGTDTTHTSGHDLVGEDEGIESEAIHQGAQQDH